MARAAPRATGLGGEGMVGLALAWGWSGDRVTMTLWGGCACPQLASEKGMQLGFGLSVPAQPVGPQCSHAKTNNHSQSRLTCAKF